MMLFQQLEYLLKFIVANGSISSYSSELHLIKEQQAAFIQKQTMGLLVGKYLETFNPEYQEYSEPEEVKEAFFSFKFQTECDDVYFETKKDVLAKMVTERNELVHHLLPKFDTKSIESCIQIGIQLDEQREKVIIEIDDLKQKVNSLQEFAQLLKSGQLELILLQQSHLVLLLGDIAIKIARADGWASITKASQLVRQQSPEEVALLKERYGHKSLKSLIQAAEVFDLYEEQTKKGIRVLYRLKSGCESL